MSTSRYRKFTAVFDSHGSQIDRSAEAAFWDFCSFWKPEIRIHGGDGFDFACLRKNASEGEKRERLQDDIDAGIDFIKRYKPTHYLRGNHCERLWDAAKADDGKLADFASYLILDIKEALGDAIMLPYDKRAGVLKIGRLKVVHGYNTGITAARIAGQVYGSVLMGHTHVIEQYSLAGLERRVARVCGCLCKLSMDYNRGHLQTLRQSHGWAYGIILPSGEYIVWQAEQINSRWIYPSEFREFRGA